MKPFYYSLNEYLRETYGTKLYKLALNGSMTCPNRDGLIDTRGCIFCSSGGSGDFAFDLKTDINKQFDNAKQLVSGKYNGSAYIAYFQSYTNTYADIDYLRRLFYPIILRDDVQILSIATRPDCLPDNVLKLLDELNHIKPVWVELGLQTIHQSTANYIRRGYSLDIFEKAVNNLLAINIKPIVHMIIGLPGEDERMILETADYIAHCGAGGVKLQLLHVLKNTDLAKDYEQGLFSTLTLEQYTYYLGRILELLPQDMVVHRLTGDGPKKLLIAPQWSADKKKVINTINNYFKENNIYQGRNFK